MAHVDSTNVQSLLQVGAHDAGVEIDFSKNVEIHSSSPDPSPTGPPLPTNRSDSVNTKPVPVPRRKSVRQDSGESGSNEAHKEMTMDKTGSLERLPPKLPPRPNDDNMQPETPQPPKRVPAMADHKTPPELPKRPCSTGPNIDVTQSDAPVVPARTDLVDTSANIDDSFPIPPPRKGRKK